MTKKLFLKSKGQYSVMARHLFLFKKCACVCIDYLRKEISCNLAMVVTRHLLGMGKREAGALGWEELNYHSLLFHILKKKLYKII